MASNQNGKREKGSKKGNKKETISHSKEFRKTTNNVILMGAPEPKKEFPRLEKESKKQLPLKDADTISSKKEEQTKIEITNNANVNSESSHMNLGRVFFGLTAFFIVFLGLGSLFNLFGSVDIGFLSLWPLILIFIGLLLFKVKSNTGKIIGILVVALVFVAALSILSRGGNTISVILSDEILMEEREIDDFETLVFNGVGDIEILKADNTSVELSGDKNVLEQITTEVEDGTLTIEYKSTIWNLFLFNEAKAQIILKTPNVADIRLIGSGTITSKAITDENVNLSIAGSGDIEIDSLNTDLLTSRITGSGNISVNGVAKQQVVFISGSGSYMGESLRSLETGVRISGNGDVLVNVETLLDVSISGSGNVTYIGNPKIRQGDFSGSGSIESWQESGVDLKLDPKEFYEKVKPVF